MDFRILGPVEVEDAGRVVDVGGPRHRTLLAALVLARNHVVSRERLVDVCWSGRPPASAASLIHVRVSELRKALGAGADGTSPVQTVGGGYRLDVSAEDVDADRFEAHADSGHRALLSSHHEAAVDLLRDAVRLWRGAAYPDLGEDAAAAAEIARLDALRLGAEDDLLEARLALGEHAAVAAELESLVLQTPWAERRWALLMLAHYRGGRQAAALAAFGAARDRLVDDLGIEPGAELRALHEAVLNQDPQLQPAPSALTLRPEEDDAARPGLPARLTSFVGRAAELAALDQVLLDARLVTIAGPGGAGKTCLAVEVAARAAATHPGGVWLVELAPVSDRELVATTIAARLGIAEQLGTSLVTQISDRLGGARCLLVVDNCEHLLDEVTGVIAQLLRETSSLTVLATSRERLGLTGEHVCQLTGLGLPVEGRDHLPGEVARAEAAQLLVARAGAVRADFRLDGRTAPPVAKICRRLDGLPLAIELAAAAVSALDITEIAGMLDDRLDLLEQRRPGRDLRHGSLESVVDWSHELLSADERAFFAHLAVFPGTFSLASAEQVCGGGPGSPSVAALLWSLVDKSLLSSETVGGGRRYRLLETLKEYALRRLAERGDLPTFRQRHAEHFLALAETAGAALRGPGREQGVAELEREHSNLRAAMEWFIENGQGGSVTRLVSSIYAFWDLGGHYGEGRRWLTRALASPQGLAPGHRVRALMGSATLAVIQGDLRAADTFSAEVVELSRAHADHEGLAHALQFRGLAAIFASDLSTADELFAESLQAARRAGQPWLEAWAFEFQAAAELARGCYDDAVRLARQSVQLARPEGDPECAAWALVTLATAEIEQGQVGSALAPLQDSLVAFRRLGVSWGLSLAVFACAQVAGLRGDHTAAAAFLGASEQLRRSSRAGMLPGLQRSFDHWRTTCAAALGPDACTAAWSAGEAETVEQTLSRAERLLAGWVVAAP